MTITGDVNPQQEALWGARAAEAARNAFFGTNLNITQGWRAEDWYIAGYVRGSAQGELDAIFVKALVAAADKVEHERRCHLRWPPTMNGRECNCVRRELDAALEAFPRDGVASSGQTYEDQGSSLVPERARQESQPPVEPPRRLVQSRSAVESWFRQGQRTLALRALDEHEVAIRAALAARYEGLREAATAFDSFIQMVDSGMSVFPFDPEHPDSEAKTYDRVQHNLRAALQALKEPADGA